MSIFSETANLDICSSIPVSFLFVLAILKIFLLLLDPEKTNVPTEIFWRNPSPYKIRIRKAFIVISFLGPLDVVEHRHEDDSCLTTCHSLLAASHSPVAAHFLLPRTFPKSTLFDSESFGRTLHTKLRQEFCVR